MDPNHLYLFDACVCAVNFTVTKLPWPQATTGTDRGTVSDRSGGQRASRPNERLLSGVLRSLGLRVEFEWNAKTESRSFALVPRPFNRRRRKRFPPLSTAASSVDAKLALLVASDADAGFLAIPCSGDSPLLQCRVLNSMCSSFRQLSDDFDEAGNRIVRHAAFAELD